MRRECMAAAAKVLNRPITQTEARDIEERMRRNARTLAQKDPKWSSKPKDQQAIETGQAVAMELIGEARLKEKRQALQLAANTRVEQFLVDQEGKGIDRLSAIDRLVAFHADMKSSTVSLEYQARAVREDFIRQLIPVMEASNPKWFGLFENVDGVRAIIKEIHGEDSGNPAAKAGAKIWAKVAADARERFNAAGGDVGQLEDWGAPQHHSQVRVARAGRDEWLQSLPLKERLKAKALDTPPPPDWARDTWVSNILPLLKREKYVNEDGRPMTDAQVTDFLKEAWLTIASGGANKLTPGQFKGGGMRANRGNAARQIHFKDADSYIQYQGNFGEKSLYEVLTSHIENISKDIALVENLGPNAELAMRYFREDAVQKATLANPAHTKSIRAHALRSERLFDVVSGKTQPVVSERMARNFDRMRNVLMSARLGGAVISSLPDEATLHLTAYINNLPHMRIVANELAAMNPLNKMEERVANRAGLGLNTYISSLNRFGQDGFGASFTRKLANTVMRVQGLNAITEARRRAFGVTMMSALGRIAQDHESLGKLDPKDKTILESKGVTDEEFQVWRAAEHEDWGNGNNTMLTPDSIYRMADAKIDDAIAATSNRFAKMKQDQQKTIDTLKARDNEDRGWVTSRAAKLSTWLAKEKQRVEDKLGKVDAAAKGDVADMHDTIGRLAENLDALAESWKNPPDANTPGIEGTRPVGFYGKGSLRSKGVDEGRAREATRQLRADIAVTKRALEGKRLETLQDFFARFREKQAEIADFTKSSDERIDRRAKVVQRLEGEIEPAIAAARKDARSKAVTRLLGTILEESDTAVVEPGARERALTGAGIQRGTIKGELARSFMLFKSFPFAMITKHFLRGWALPTGAGKAAYLSSLIAASTMLGALSMQVKELLSGRDPRNLNPFQGDYGGRNWLKALLQGGSLGLYGDFLFSEASSHGQSALTSFLGPVAGEVDDTLKLTQGNMVQASRGENTDFGAELTKFVQGNLPGANLWYTKAVLDHMIFHNLQEYFSPGYLSRMRKSAYRNFGQQYWWEPGEISPSRAPNLGTAVGAEQ